MINILVLNAGSSSLKFQLLKMPNEKVLISGQVERIGFHDAITQYNFKKKKEKKTSAVLNHSEALEWIAETILKTCQVVSSVKDIHAVGHRVVHGGNAFTDTTEINTSVKEAIEALSKLAPLHNPPNLKGIEVAEKVFSSARQFGVFDTSFHQTMPEKAYRYAINKNLADQHNVRAYGFHGTSHKYVSEKAKEILADTDKLITIHLGNGCSISAIKNGKCIDHSLGFGPVNGLIMGTRSGDIDQSVIFYLADKLELSIDEVNHLLQKESGMLGLTGFSDLREIGNAAIQGDLNCKLALEMSAYRIKKYIGAYIACLNGINAIIFTAGIGENSDLMRALVCKDLDYFGIELDEDLNKIRTSKPRVISIKESKVKIAVIPTNEELEIAKQTYKCYLQN